MPELPEVAALVEHLRTHAVERVLTRIDVASPNVLKTARPPVTDLHGREVTGAARHGKYLALECGGTHLVAHLARAGWLRWSDRMPQAPPKPGRGPIALRVHLADPDTPAGFDLTEAGTQKSLAVWVVSDPCEVPGIARLGPDAVEVGRAQFGALLHGRPERVKTLLTDQSVLSGVGNAYSDEILHAARLSPFATAGKLDEAAADRLHESIRAVLTGAARRAAEQDVARLKAAKRSGLRVHGRAGTPCPVCSDAVREVSYSEHALQYCPTCQTGGKVLADRRRSRLLK